MDIKGLATLAITQVGLRGIDWASLAQKGRASVWVRDYMTEYLVPAQMAMAGVVGSLDLIPGGDPTKFQNSYSATNSALSSLAGTLGSLGPGAPLDAIKATLALSRESLRVFVSHAYAAATYGALLHYDETIHHSGASDAEIATHANITVGMMNSIVTLDKMKFWDLMGMRVGSAQSGLGVAPLVLAAGVVVAVAALAVLAWMIVSVVDLMKTNKIVSTMCQNAQASGDVATTQQCINTLTDKSRAAGTLVPDLLGSAFKAALPYVFGALALYGLFLAAPTIVKTLTTKGAHA